MAKVRKVLLETYPVLTRQKRANLAMALAASHALNAWFAPIFQAAWDAGCNTLFSEDLQAVRTT